MTSNKKNFLSEKYNISCEIPVLSGLKFLAVFIGLFFLNSCNGGGGGNSAPAKPLTDPPPIIIKTDYFEFESPAGTPEPLPSVSSSPETLVGNFKYKVANFIIKNIKLCHINLETPDPNPCQDFPIPPNDPKVEMWFENGSATSADLAAIQKNNDFEITIDKKLQCKNSGNPKRPNICDADPGSPIIVKKIRIGGKDFPNTELDYYIVNFYNQ